MNVRNYNIFFHTHTISGIIITALLYVIFFAGSLSFFKNEISAWQHNQSIQGKAVPDFNRIADSLDHQFDLKGREVSFYMTAHSSTVRVNVGHSVDSLNSKKDTSSFFYLDPKTAVGKGYKEQYDLGEFLYRLHFFAPMNAGRGLPLGYYLSGSIAFIFLFALITGLLVHWDKIVSNFHLFRPREKLKTVWTDLHTALGVITFPFLFVFAVTGAYFMLSYALFSGPALTFQYKGNEAAMNTDLGFAPHTYEYTYEKIQQKPNLNALVNGLYQEWGRDAEISHLEVINYGDANMHIIVEGAMSVNKQFTSKGEFIYDAGSGKVISNIHPSKGDKYTDVADNLLYVLHFGNYGGFAVKILYFALGVCGCIVIISGVMIWLVARDKKHIPEYKRKFNFWLANIYLSICLGMLPVTAAAFIAVKINPEGGMSFIYRFYFWSWLVVSLVLISLRNIHKVNNYSLLSGALIGVCIPVVNGITTGNWIWVSFSNHYRDVMLIDVFWLVMSVGLLICWRLSVKKQQKEKTPEKKLAAAGAGSLSSIPADRH